MQCMRALDMKNKTKNLFFRDDIKNNDTQLSIFVRVNTMMTFNSFVFLLLASSASAFNVLVIGGTRFSGAYLWKELNDRGHSVTVYNRGKTQPKPVVWESDDAFNARIAATTFLKGDRKDPEQLASLIDPSKYEYVFDMNAREQSDTEPLANLFVGQSNFKQYVFMSSAGKKPSNDCVCVVYVCLCSRQNDLSLNFF